MTLGDKIKFIRKEKGLTQKALAKKLETTQQNLAQYENGKRQPKIETIEKIAYALGVPRTDLLDWKDIPELANNLYTSDLSSFKDSLKEDCYKLNEDERKSFIEKIDNCIAVGENIENLSDRETYFANATLDIGCELLRHLLNLGYTDDISITVDLVAKFLTLNDNLQNLVWELVENLCGNGYISQTSTDTDSQS